MRGLVLTQAERADHYQPSVSPIYFEKLVGVSNAAEFLTKVGPVHSGEEELRLRIIDILNHIETNVAYFAE